MTIGGLCAHIEEGGLSLCRSITVVGRALANDVGGWNLFVSCQKKKMAIVRESRRPLTAVNDNIGMNFIDNCLQSGINDEFIQIDVSSTYSVGLALIDAEEKRHSSLISPKFVGALHQKGPTRVDGLPVAAFQKDDAESITLLKHGKIDDPKIDCPLL
eukprot:Gb_23541 [translate_table: standard]